VDGLEDRDQVVLAVTFVLGRVGEPERDPVGHALGGRVAIRALDRARVDVDAMDDHTRKVVGDRDRRPARPAGDVRDPAGTVAQAGGDVRHRVDPRADEMGELRPVDRLLGLDDVRAVVRPVDARTGAIGREQIGHPLGGAHHEPRKRREEREAVRVDEDLVVTGRQRVPALVRVGVHIVHFEDGRDRLLLEPLAGVAGIDAGPYRELGRGGRPAVMEVPVETQPFTEVDGLELERPEDVPEQALGERVPAGGRIGQDGRGRHRRAPRALVSGQTADGGTGAFGRGMDISRCRMPVGDGRPDGERVPGVSPRPPRAACPGSAASPAPGGCRRRSCRAIR
jgi:hypothetical protein